MKRGLIQSVRINQFVFDFITFKEFHDPCLMPPNYGHMHVSTQEASASGLPATSDKKALVFHHTVKRMYTVSSSMVFTSSLSTMRRFLNQNSAI